MHKKKKKQTLPPVALFLLKFVLPVLVSLVLLILSIYLTSHSKLESYKNTVESVLERKYNKDVEVVPLISESSPYPLSSKIFIINSGSTYTHAVLITMMGFSGPVVGVFEYSQDFLPLFAGVAGFEDSQVEPISVGLTNQLIYFWSQKVTEICAKVVQE